MINNIFNIVAFNLNDYLEKMDSDKHQLQKIVNYNKSIWGSSYRIYNEKSRILDKSVQEIIDNSIFCQKVLSREKKDYRLIKDYLEWYYTQHVKHPAIIIDLDVALASIGNTEHLANDKIYMAPNINQPSLYFMLSFTPLTSIDIMAELDNQDYEYVSDTEFINDMTYKHPEINFWSFIDSNTINIQPSIGPATPK